MSLFDVFGDGSRRPPAPEIATPEDVHEYNIEYAKSHGLEAGDLDGGNDDPTMSLPFADEEFQKDLPGAKQKADFPWLSDPKRGVAWDFSPVELRNLAQANTWVGMLVQSITSEIAEVPFTITDEDNRQESTKRLSTHPEEREPVQKELPDSTAESIFDLLHDPNPDDNWQDMVEMWLGDLLEIGSMTVVKAFPESDYTGDEFTTDPANTRPLALQTSAPEVWTKDYHNRTGILEGFWQFDRTAAPGSGDSGGQVRSRRGVMDPTFFDTDEIVWNDLQPRSNRRYGMPPTLLVKDFLKSIDLAVTQEQQYLSRGSIPSGAWVFENWDRQQVKEWKQENEENIKGKPHKSLMFAGRGGDVRFEPMSMNFSELEFTERMRWYARVVASVFQVPTAVVGIEPEKINYNTFQGERENFESNTLGPYLQELERVINDQIIRPHWDGYRFEFKPGMSESTRGMISERVRSEWDSGLITRNEARRELGREPVEDDEDGYKPEVAPEPDTQGGAGVAEMMAEHLSKDAGDFEADVFQVLAPEDRADEFDDRVLGIGVDFPNDAVYVDWRNEVFPDELENSHVSIYGTVADLEQATGNETATMETVNAAEQVELAASVVKSAREGGSGNSKARKDSEPLRGTDEWYLFDVQPSDVAELQAEIADDVRELFDDLLADEDLQATIERLAVEDDETSKSLNDVTQVIREKLEDNRTAAAISEAIRTHTAEQVSESMREAIDDAEGAPDEAPDVDAIQSRLEDRSVAFADEFAERMSTEVRGAVADGWEEGKNSLEIAEDIGDIADMSEGWNGAEKIARQELQVATGQARSAVADELDKVEVWVTAGDNRVRDAHGEMDGAWKRPSEQWEVDYSDRGRGVQKEDVPGDSEPGIGCRCQTLLRDIDEVDPDLHAGV